MINRSLVVATLCLLLPASWAFALSRGHTILMDDGYQIQALVYTGVGGTFVPLDVAQFQQANFTTSIFRSANDADQTGSAPGDIQWGAIYVPDETFRFVPEAQEPWVPNMVTYQYSDEVDLTVLYNKIDAQFWMSSIKTRYPGVIAHTNEYGWQHTYAEMRDFISYAEPDMVMFDTYPFWGGLQGGSPTTLYRDMIKYRRLGCEGIDGTGTEPIPYGMYLQTYTTPSAHVISDSEMRLNQFAALTAGFKVTRAWTYNTGEADFSQSSVLFSDLLAQSPTAQYSQIAETNRQALNLGTSLVRMQSSGLYFIMGQHDVDGVPPVVGVDNTLPTDAQVWSAASDPYITSISATNLGSKNDGLRGDILVGYFNPLIEADDGPSYTGEIYFMVTNGLSDAAGLVSETRQSVHLEFDFLASGINSLLRLDRDTGQVETVSLVHDIGSLYHLDLVLDGGTGDLFKFNTGALFVGTLPGDVNSDGFVDGDDLDVVISNWGLTGAARRQGDLTGEGKVGGLDYNEVLNNWGAGSPPEPHGAIPEPATLALFGLGAWVSILGRRRK